MPSRQMAKTLLLLILLTARAYPQEPAPELKQHLPPTLEELAQAAGLKWLVAQQQADGGWESERVIDPTTKKDQVRLGRNGAGTHHALSKQPHES